MGATLYGGVQAASKYQSLALGWGQNLGAVGALSADVTQAWTKQETRPKEQGQSWRLRYGKNFIETGTNFSLASYRYSTRGFYNLQEALESYGGNSAIYNDHKKSRAELTMSQSLWEQGERCRSACLTKTTGTITAVRSLSASATTTAGRPSVTG